MYAPLVERVDSEDDHIMVYLKEVRGLQYSWVNIVFLLFIMLIVLWFLQVPKSSPQLYTIQMKQVFPVIGLRPAVIKVYDYYQTSMVSFHLMHLILVYFTEQLTALSCCVSSLR